MEQIPQSRATVDDVLTSGESRRELRRSMENEALAKGSDKVILSNLMLAGMVILAAMCSMFGVELSFGEIRDLTLLSVILYAITSMVYRNRYARGKMRGKRDGDYLLALNGYRERRGIIDLRGLVSSVPLFCREYKKRELREYRSDLLIDVDMTYEEYKDHYMRRSDKQIMKLDLPLDTRRVLIKCNHAKPLRLTPGMILNENGEAERQELMGQSGRERERKDKRKQMIQRALLVLFGGIVTFSFVTEFTLANVLRWAVRMVPIAMAIIFGDDDGYCNITVTETAFKRAQSSVINLLFEWDDGRKGATLQDEMQDENK